MRYSADCTVSGCRRSASAASSSASRRRASASSRERLASDVIDACSSKRSATAHKAKYPALGGDRPGRGLTVCVPNARAGCVLGSLSVHRDVDARRSQASSAPLKPISEGARFRAASSRVIPSSYQRRAFPPSPVLVVGLVDLVVTAERSRSASLAGLDVAPKVLVITGHLTIDGALRNRLQHSHEPAQLTCGHECRRPDT